MLKIFFYYFFLIIILICLTVTVFPYLSIKEKSPDILLIFIIFLAQRKGVMKGQVAGFCLGLLMDLLSGGFFGTRSASYLIIGNVAGYIYRRFIVTELSVKVLIMFLMASFYSLLIYLFRIIFYKISFLTYISNIWVFILYTTLISPLFFVIFEFLDRNLIES
jgi:rod shape-determining protein MreD